MSDSTTVLRYTGGGHGGWLPGVPARDLAADEADAHGGVAALLVTGVYEAIEQAEKPAPDQDKRLPGPSENKNRAGDA